MLINSRTGQSLSLLHIVIVSTSCFHSASLVSFLSVLSFCLALFLFIFSFHHPVFSPPPILSLPLSFHPSLFLSSGGLFLGCLVNFRREVTLSARESGTHIKKPKDKQTSNSFSSFFSISARHCITALFPISVGAWMCVCVRACAWKVFHLQLNYVIKSPFFSFKKKLPHDQFKLQHYRSLGNFLNLELPLNIMSYESLRSSVW